MVDRVKALLEEMALLRDEDEEDRSADIASSAARPHAEILARSFMADAGMDIDDHQHVVVFLNMIALHMRAGSRPKRYPYDKFTTLEIAHSWLERRDKLSSEASGTTSNSIATLMRNNDPRLQDFEVNPIRVALDRAIDAALKGSLKLIKNAAGEFEVLNDEQADRLKAMLPLFRKLKHNGKKPHNSAQDHLCS